jgi:hypothetical protein
MDLAPKRGVDLNQEVDSVGPPWPGTPRIEQEAPVAESTEFIAPILRADDTYRVRFLGGPFEGAMGKQLSRGGAEERISRDIENGTRTVWYECTGATGERAGVSTWDYRYEGTVTAAD